MAPQKALLRMQSLHQLPEGSNGGNNAASHLINCALHAVTRRMSRLADPRMRALSSVSALQSLWVGSRANYAGYPRAPVRRKRGDVHSDLTAVVLQLPEQGEQRPLVDSWAL